jgi:competence protein ComEA
MLNAVRRLQSIGLAVALALLVSSTLAAAPAPSESRVDLNAATIEQLTDLPGIGPALAARIVEHREKSGPFKAVEELMNVKGIGEKSFAKLQERVTVGKAQRAQEGR